MLWLLLLRAARNTFIPVMIILFVAIVVIHCRLLFAGEKNTKHCFALAISYPETHSSNQSIDRYLCSYRTQAVVVVHIHTRNEQLLQDTCALEIFSIWLQRLLLLLRESEKQMHCIIIHSGRSACGPRRRLLRGWRPLLLLLIVAMGEITRIGLGISKGWSDILADCLFPDGRRIFPE